MASGAGQSRVIEPSLAQFDTRSIDLKCNFWRPHLLCNGGTAGQHHLHNHGSYEQSRIPLPDEGRDALAPGGDSDTTLAEVTPDTVASQAFPSEM